ncbi:MAG: hypothetical protein JXM79_15135 [Sedimentisphaerales bacterium]|nr:hypothetical protein [Sedimentisphaerales bacterium]
MHTIGKNWDYLIITASNTAQAKAYETQLRLRQQLGLLESVRDVRVVPDPGGRRVGSGGSTIGCLLEVLQRELGRHIHSSTSETWQKTLQSLRILIVHAGGDSRRLPAYGPCGKLFIPVPGENDGCLPLTLFDRQLPTYLHLPAPVDGAGQIVITSGDVLLEFDVRTVSFDRKGLIGLGCYAPTEQAKNHGVFCCDNRHRVTRFLQKPSPEDQRKMKAINPYGQSLLDIGVMNFDTDTAVKLLKIFCPQLQTDGQFTLSGKMGEAAIKQGLDFYREICCGIGAETHLTHYIRSVQQSGSTWDEPLLAQLFKLLRDIPFHANVVPQCEFLHFGTSRQIISSGNILTQNDLGSTSLRTCLSINNDVTDSGRVMGTKAWVEGCNILSTLTLGGENIVVGVDVDKPLSLPAQMSLDVIQGRDRNDENVWFVRCYDVNDMFNTSVGRDATFCKLPILEWLEIVGAQPEEIWDNHIPPEKRSLWNARVFPAVKKHAQYHEWLWMFNPNKAHREKHKAWLEADRYSSAEIAILADHDIFYRKRNIIRAIEIKKSLRYIFRPKSKFSANELAYLLKSETQPSAWIADILKEARWRQDNDTTQSLDSMIFPRIMHTLGSALLKLEEEKILDERTLVEVSEKLAVVERRWLDSIELKPDASIPLNQWAKRACHLAFQSLGQSIISSGGDNLSPPRSALRSDEIVWGRAPARFDTGGGWTDTPPYSLEHGGCVIDTAVNLNGQPPIQVYMRVTDEPVIRIGSIDLGTRIEITSLDELLDYRKASGEYSLAKAALALSGFSPETARWPQHSSLRHMLEQFGGGVELTTLAAIPKGSGLGTSSIMGAVILAVIHRVMGRTLTQKELFHAVLRLEQSLTTGGGWQDQIGGAVGGTKIVSAEPGLVPDAKIHYLPADVLDPKVNNGQTLLYYTGITRLAKGILGQVVGHYLDRDRKTLSTLRQIHALAPQVADALSRKDIQAFGKLVDVAWKLNKQLDPNSTNEQVETLFTRIQPYVFGAKLLGAGGGGFLLMVCKSPEDAQKIKTILDEKPVNERARFFDYDINPEGLVVTVC